MEVTNATAGASAGTTTSRPETQGAVVSSDFETFLKMLTVQMENQDPLNPIESTDYAVQLATFSGVEQQVKTNDLLTALADQLSLQNMSDLAGWVGMEASAAVPVWFENTPITLSPAPDTGADQAFVLVRDASGDLCDRIEIPVSDEPLQWAGTDPSGHAFAPGLYKFELQSYSQGELISTRTIAAYGTVAEARSEGGETILVLEGGAEVKASDVAALRAPQV